MKMRFYLSSGKKIDIRIDEITDNAYMYIGEINGEQVFSEWADSEWLTEKVDQCGYHDGISQEDYAELCSRIDEVVTALALTLDATIFSNNYYATGFSCDSDELKNLIEKVF